MLCYLLVFHLRVRGVVAHTGLRPPRTVSVDEGLPAPALRGHEGVFMVYGLGEHRKREIVAAGYWKKNIKLYKFIKHVQLASYPCFASETVSLNKKA